jgi:hypothetical protein
MRRTFGATVIALILAVAGAVTAGPFDDAEAAPGLRMFFLVGCGTDN